MTIVLHGFGGGEMGDVLTDGYCPDMSTPYVYGAIAGAVGSVGVSIITTPVKHGTGALSVAGSGYSNGLAPCVDTAITLVQGWASWNGYPASNTVIMNFLGASLFGPYLESDTTGHLRVGWNGAGDPWHPRSGWSGAAIGNGTYNHVAVLYDPLTLPGHVFMIVLIDSVLQIMCDLGNVTPSANVYWQLRNDVYPNSAIMWDDVCALASSSAADAPHLLQWPVARVVAQRPIADGSYNQWSQIPNDALAHYLKWNDPGANDGDTTYLYFNNPAGALIQDAAFPSADTLGLNASATPLGLPVWSAAHKGGFSKGWSASTYCSLANTVSVPAPAATYAASLYPLTRSSGSWGRADLTSVKAGGQCTGPVSGAWWHITSFGLQWAFCDNVYLPLTPRPTVAFGQVF